MGSSEVFSGSLSVPAPASRGRPSRSVETSPACDVRSGLAPVLGTAGALIFMPTSRVLTLGDVAARDGFLPAAPHVARRQTPQSFSASGGHGQAFRECGRSRRVRGPESCRWTVRGTAEAPSASSVESRRPVRARETRFAEHLAGGIAEGVWLCHRLLRASFLQTELGERSLPGARPSGPPVGFA